MESPVFLRSAAHVRDFPEDVGREVAIVGRSNSGKSTAVNCITGFGKLARVSKTPGRTQLVNFFAVGTDARLVDLPGYGYARVPAAVQRRWQGLVDAYLSDRRSLTGLLITIDIRRGLMASDRTMIAAARRLGLPTLLLLTKADKLSRGPGLEARRAAAEASGLECVLFAAPTRQGVDEVRARLAAWLGPPQAAA